MSHPARSRNQTTDYVLTDRSAEDEHNELIRSTPNSDISDREERQQQEDEDEDYDNDSEDGRQTQQEVEDDVAVALITGKVGDTHLYSKKGESPGPANHDSFSKQEKLGNHSDCCSGSFESDGVLGGHVLLSGNDRLHPTAHCTRSASIILSRGLPVNMDSTPSPIGTLRNLTPPLPAIKGHSSIQSWQIRGARRRLTVT